MYNILASTSQCKTVLQTVYNERPPSYSSNVVSHSCQSNNTH